MAGIYKILEKYGSIKNIFLKILVLLCLVALAYWMIIGFMFTVNKLFNPIGI